MILRWTAGIVIAALVLGGGTRTGRLSDALLQIAAIPLLLLAGARHLEIAGERGVPWRLVAVGGIVLVPVLQLVPLPASLWLALPHRTRLAEAYALTGQALPGGRALPGSMPLSLTPRETWLAVLSLLPPVAVFLGVLLLPYRQRRHLMLAVIIVGMLTVLLGLLQIAQGPASPLRFFEITNATHAVGTFANRNHFAALIYTLVVLVGAWVVTPVAIADSGASRRNRDTRWILDRVTGVFAFMTLLAAQAMTQSRAGLILMVLAIIAVVGFSLSARVQQSHQAAKHVIGAAVVFGLLLALPHAMLGIMARFQSDVATDPRTIFAHTTTEAAKVFLPWGSGVGSFAATYQMLEKTADLDADTYANRAHNELLEIWLESGVIGIAVLLAFTVWLASRFIFYWRGDGRAKLGVLDLMLARGAAVIVALLMAHSLLDYPLRTAALMTIAGLCCAMLVPPVLPRQEDDEAAPVLRQRAKARAAVHPLQPIKIGSAPVEVRPGPTALSWPTGRDMGARTQESAWPREWTGSMTEAPKPAVKRLK